MTAWVFLAVAICAEVAGTSLLPRSDGFRKPAPTVAVLGLYGAALYCLSQALRQLDVGVAYAVWAGVGTAVIGGDPRATTESAKAVPPGDHLLDEPARRDPA